MQNGIIEHCWSIYNNRWPCTFTIKSKKRKKNCCRWGAAIVSFVSPHITRLGDCESAKICNILRFGVESFQQIASCWLCSKIYKEFGNEMGHHQIWCYQVYRTLYNLACCLWIKDRDWRYIAKALDLYTTKHWNHQTFTFIHAWYVLKDIPQWANLWREKKKTSL